MDEQSTQPQESQPVVPPEQGRSPAAFNPKAPQFPPTPAPQPGKMNEPQTQAPSVNYEAVQSGEVLSQTPSTWGDAFINSLHQSAQGNMIGALGIDEQGSLTRRLNEYAIESAPNVKPAISKDEANAKARSAGSTISFNEDTNPDIVDMRINEDKHRQLLRDWGAQLGDHFGSEPVAGLVGGLLDPLNIFLGTVTGGLGELAGVSQGIKMIAAENFALNAAQNVAGYYQEKREGQNPQLSEKIADTISGTIAGVGLHYTIGAAVKGLKSVFKAGAEYIKSAPEDIVRGGIKGGVLEEENGVKPGTVTNALASVEQARLRGQIEGAPTQYSFKPSEHPSDRPFYGARNFKSENVHDSNLGPGTDLTDNAGYKNHQVSNPGGEAGQLGEYKLPSEGKYLDIDQSAGSPEVKKFESAVEEKLGSPLEVKEGESIKDVIERMGEMAKDGKAPADILEQVQGIAKSEGFEGYKHVIGDTESGTQQNAVHLFDENAKPGKIMGANPDVTPKLTGDQLKAREKDLNNLEKSKYYDEEGQKIIREVSHGKPPGVPSEQMQINEDSYNQARAQLDQMAKSDKGLASELKVELDHESVIDRQEKNVMEKLSGCLGGDGWQ